MERKTHPFNNQKQRRKGGAPRQEKTKSKSSYGARAVPPADRLSIVQVVQGFGAPAGEVLVCECQ